MPDWVVHLGAASLIGRVCRFRDIRWFFLGAVLPDLLAVMSMVFLDFSPVSPFPGTPVARTYFRLLHTPFMAILAAVIFSFFSSCYLKSAGLTVCGVLSHFALDLLQKSASGGIALFFPFSFSLFSTQIIYYTKPFIPLTAVFFLPLLIHSFLCKRKPYEQKIPLQITKRIILVFPFLVVFILTPWFFLEKAYEANIENVRFITRPAEYDGLPVYLSVSKVAAIDDVKMTVREGTADFKIKPVCSPLYSRVFKKLKKDDWITVKGMYKDGIIYAEYIHKDSPYYQIKIILSLIGMTCVILYWFYYFKKKY